MASIEKEISYQSTNTYSTLNTVTSETKNVWIVFHGIGYLSRYFIKLFEGFDASENYFIAPQGPSKYYKGNDYRRVGSSWLTKENTKTETNNVLEYIDAVIAAENIPSTTKVVVLGYSQGVSIATRWVASRKIDCSSLVMVSGGFPKELTKEDFAFFSKENKVSFILGKKDPYIILDKIEMEKKRIIEILPNLIFETHPGGHELVPETLMNSF